VPIIVTGNDMSRLYAPLTRSGRMDLWMWEPDRTEITRWGPAEMTVSNADVHDDNGPTAAVMAAMSPYSST
jgi:hypothetical protein